MFVDSRCVPPSEARIVARATRGRFSLDTLPMRPSSRGIMLACLFMMMSGFLVQDAQSVDRGRQPFEARCGRCHGADGNGGDMGPPIASRLAARDDRQLARLNPAGPPGPGLT